MQGIRPRAGAAGRPGAGLQTAWLQLLLVRRGAEHRVYYAQRVEGNA